MILCEFLIMHPNAIHLMSHYIQPCLSFQTYCPKKTKHRQAKHTNKQTKHRKKFLAVCHGVSYSIPFCQKQLYLQMFVAMIYWCGLRPLASAIPSTLDPHQDSSWISHCCSCIIKILQFWFCRMSPSQDQTVFRWGRCSGGLT